MKINKLQPLKKVVQMERTNQERRIQYSNNNKAAVYYDMRTFFVGGIQPCAQELKNCLGSSSNSTPNPDHPKAKRLNTSGGVFEASFLPSDH